MLRKAAADSQTRTTVEGILKQIHDEDPSFWPYGLASDQFNGGLYLVQKSASADPVGFVGWQKFQEGPRVVGYYAIGILPEHRQQGFAKSAVSQALREIGNECDEIRALIMAHNGPSKALAGSLGIPVIEKLAAEKFGNTKAQALSGLIGALGSTIFFDQTADPERSLGSSFQPWKWDKERALMGGMNAILGGLGGQQMGQGEFGRGLAAIALAPTKDLAVKGIGSLHRIDEAAKKFSETAGVGGSLKGVHPAVLAGAGGLGLGALALLAYNAKRKADHRDADLALKSKGRVRITLPTTAPGDNETEVELPFDDLNLSQALRSRLGRDTKRRLYLETRQRTRRRRPKDPTKASPREQEDLAMEQEEEELDKAASLLSLIQEIGFYKAASKMPQVVPTPPPTGQNPALRMSQQDQAVAQSIQPAPEANPEILKAQQAAMQAEQAGQQQLAQVEQASQQAQMEQQAQFQQALTKSEQEKEVLKLQLEKEKALQELKEAKNEADAEVGAGSGGQAKALVASRLDRLESRVKAASTVPAATAPGALDPKTGQPIPLPPIHLRPQAAQGYNQHAGAAGLIPTVSTARHSYGKVGDTLYDMFLRKRLTTPDAPAAGVIGRTSMLNTPDRMGMIETLLSSAPAVNTSAMTGLV